MLESTSFSLDLLDVLAGNRSIVDLPGLHLQDEAQASGFLKAYGFDLSIPGDQKKLVYYYRRALVFIIEKLEIPEDSLPPLLLDPEKIEPLTRVLMWASNSFKYEEPLAQQAPLRRWSCVMLRVMHAFIHAENDLFHLYSEEIQKQILSPIQDCIAIEGNEARPYLRWPEAPNQAISLEFFEVKPHKASVSSVIKLLSKAETHMINLHDKIGVRFVTRNILDAFRVLQFLVEHHLVGVAHVMAGQTSNNLYPVALFQEFMKVYPNIQDQSPDHIEQALLKFQLDYLNQVETVVKENAFSANNYRFIKFVARRLVRLPENAGQFFYPFEIQILTREAYEHTLQGDGDHKKYKQRQLDAAKKRVLEQ